jgi:NAD(P)-dependent dehydrogenase (short-subunit alcohol dehydrogenase family)
MFRQHSEATQQAILAKLTPPRLATLADVLHVLDFFCDDAASNVTGQCVYLGGIR